MRKASFISRHCLKSFLLQSYNIFLNPPTICPLFSTMVTPREHI
jgi:hypothetical protein